MIEHTPTYSLADVDPSAFCASCGQCCKRMPGNISPEQLQPDVEANLRRLLATGNYAIDWWEGDPRGGPFLKSGIGKAHFLRPRHKSRPGKIFDPSWGDSPCVFLSDNGCILPRSQRPKECLEMVPVRGGACLSTFPKQRAAIAWLPFNDMLERIGHDVSKSE